METNMQTRRQFIAARILTGIALTAFASIAPVAQPKLLWAFHLAVRQMPSHAYWRIN
jgi:hypothetical protein